MSFIKKIFSTEDGKEIGRQKANVAEPPMKEESIPPPPVTTRQKIQIIKSADGKMQVRGLLPGQQLVQMPDGKLQVFTQLPPKSTPSQQQQLLPNPMSGRQQSIGQPQFPLCSLPETVLENVLLFLPYDTIAKLRRVNRRFDAICKSLLNKGFRIAQRNVENSLQQVKSKLPRRDSERVSHPMWKDHSILTDLTLEVALIDLEFEKFINNHFCCFIPGKVLDEIFTILSTLREQQDANRPYSILNELEDLSKMALEYFEENIAPSFRKERAPLNIPLKFPVEEEDPGSDECEDGPVADIRENKEAIRACGRRVLKLTKQKKQMKVQLKNMAMQMKHQNVRFNATVKQLKANYEATMKQQEKNFEATMKEMNLKIEDLDRKVKNQGAVNTDKQAALGDKDPELNELKEELSESDLSNGNKGIHADQIIDGNGLEVSQTVETRSSKRKRESF